MVLRRFGPALFLGCVIVAGPASATEEQTPAEYLPNARDAKIVSVSTTGQPAARIIVQTQAVAIKETGPKETVARFGEVYAFAPATFIVHRDEPTLIEFWNLQPDDDHDFMLMDPKWSVMMKVTLPALKKTSVHLHIPSRRPVQLLVRDAPARDEWGNPGGVSSIAVALPQPEPVAPPAVLDLFFSVPSIVGGRSDGQGPVDANQDHCVDVARHARVPIHPARLQEHVVRAMDPPLPFESIPFSNERIDHVDLSGRVSLEVLNRLRRPDVGKHEVVVIPDGGRSFRRQIWCAVGAHGGDVSQSLLPSRSASCHR